MATPILLSTSNWNELNVEQAETESNNPKEVMFELGFKGGTEVKEGRSRRKYRIWFIKGFSEYQIQLQPLFICNTVRKSLPQKVSLLFFKPSKVVCRGL